VLPLRDLNPTRSTPVLTYLLIAVNTAVYTHQFMLGPEGAELFVRRYGLIPAMIAEHHHFGSLITPFTSMFMHGSWLHLIMNMWFLHIFGDNVEDALGKPRFVLFYLCTGLGAAAAQTFIDPSNMVPMVGASGAIAGVLAAYMRLFPHTRVVTLIPQLPWGLIFPFLYVARELPAGLLIMFWFALQLLSGVGSLGAAQGGGVAFFAHIGGFVAGFLLIGLFRPRRNITRGFRGPERYSH
jgi:membrane associated rhomboid family serine protease